MPNVELGDLTARQIARLSFTILKRLDRKMSALTDAIDHLNTEVGQAVTLLRSTATDQTSKISELQTALQAERDAAAALLASEDAEDESQNAALEAAQDEVDRLTAEIATAVDSINAAADTLDGAVPNASDLPDEPETPATPETPTEEPSEPVEEPTEPVEAPADPSPTPEPATDSPATPAPSDDVPVEDNGSTFSDGRDERA